MHLFKIVDKGIEFPSTGSGVYLTVGGDVVCGFKVSCELSFGFRRGQELELRAGILEGSRVPLLAGRLVLLVRFFASTVKLFAVTHVEIATVTAVGFAVDLIDA